MADPPADVAGVAARLTAREAEGLHRTALRFVTALPERVPLGDLVGAWLSELIGRYEPRAASGGVYPHQAEVLRLFGESELPSIVLSSSTGTGKSLCFWAWVIEALRRDARATALACFPTQALMWGQADRLARISAPGSLITSVRGDCLGGTLRFGGAEVGWTAWKGVGGDEDMEAHQSSDAFRRARIRLSTLDKAHHSLIAEWPEFTARLAALVLDEVHTYDGVFGANTHYFLRRVHAAIEAFGGQRPPVFLASATLANAEAFARRLAALDDGGRLEHVCDRTATRVEAVPVREVAAALQRGLAAGPAAGCLERYALLLDDPGEGKRFARRLGDAAVFGRDVNVIFFSPYKFQSRRLNLSLEAVRRDGREAVVYDADLPTPRRREVERMFNSGERRGLILIGTNALELGVDIDALDVCVIDELPTSRAQLLQRIGRVGRRPGRPGLVLLRLGGQPTDRDIAADPAAAMAPELAGGLPIPVHLDAIRWKHALACHRELARFGRGGSPQRFVARHFGIRLSEEELQRAYFERFGALVDNQSPYWMYSGLRAKASERKVPVVELDRWDHEGRPRFRLDENRRRCDVASIEDVNVFRDAHPEAVLIGYDGRRWRVAAYGEKEADARPQAGDAVGQWLKALDMIYVEPVDSGVISRGVVIDSQTFVAAEDIPAGLTLPGRGELRFGIWEFRRKWDGYREINLATDRAVRVGLDQVLTRFHQARQDGEHFPFLHDWGYRTLGWEWSWELSPEELQHASPEGAAFRARLLAPYFATVLESTTRELNLAGGVSGGAQWLRVLDAQPGGNGLSAALLADGRLERALERLRADVAAQGGDPGRLRKFARRLIGEDWVGGSRNTVCSKMGTNWDG